MTLKATAFAAVLLLCGTAASSHEFVHGTLTIGHPYARPTAPAQPTGGGYLKLINNGADDRLVSARTPVAASVEMHTMRLEGDVMRMREIGSIEVPAGKTVELKPGGLHLMLTGLKAPLIAGQTFPMTLKFEKAGEVEVTVNVSAPKVEEMASDKDHAAAHGKAH